MRLAQVTAVFELGHHVANHRGAHAELMARDNLRGSDGLRGRDELLHGREYQRVLTIRERVGFLRHLLGVARATLLRFCYSFSDTFKNHRNAMAGTRVMASRFSVT